MGWTPRSTKLSTRPPFPVLAGDFFHFSFCARWHKMDKGWKKVKIGACSAKKSRLSASADITGELETRRAGESSKLSANRSLVEHLWNMEQKSTSFQVGHSSSYFEGAWRGKRTKKWMVLIHSEIADFPSYSTGLRLPWIGRSSLLALQWLPRTDVSFWKLSWVQFPGSKMNFSRNGEQKLHWRGKLRREEKVDRC